MAKDTKKSMPMPKAGTKMTGGAAGGLGRLQKSAAAAKGGKK